MKKIVLVILLVGSIFGYYKYIDNQKKSENTDVSKNMLESFMTNNKEVTAMISIKYEVDEQVTTNIITDYYKAHDFMYGLVSYDGTDMKEHKNNTDYSNTIKRLGETYKLDKAKVASMLLDYKLYRSKVEEELSMYVDEEDKIK